MNNCVYGVNMWEIIRTYNMHETHTVFVMTMTMFEKVGPVDRTVITWRKLRCEHRAMAEKCNGERGEGTAL